MGVVTSGLGLGSRGIYVHVLWEWEFMCARPHPCPLRDRHNPCEN